MIRKAPKNQKSKRVELQCGIGVHTFDRNVLYPLWCPNRKSLKSRTETDCKKVKKRTEQIRIIHGIPHPSKTRKLILQKKKIQLCSMHFNIKALLLAQTWSLCAVPYLQTNAGTLNVYKNISNKIHVKKPQRNILIHKQGRVQKLFNDTT